MRRFSLLIIVCIAAVFLTACEQEPQPLEVIKIPFAGESVMGEIDGGVYRYFRYESVEAALIDKTKVSADGSKIDGRQMPWNGNVHFYHLAKRIVIYVGDEPKVIEAIENIFGMEFAGTSVPIQ